MWQRSLGSSYYWLRTLGGRKPRAEKGQEEHSTLPPQAPGPDILLGQVSQVWDKSESGAQLQKSRHWWGMGVRLEARLAGDRATHSWLHREPGSP